MSTPFSIRKTRHLGKGAIILGSLVLAAATIGQAAEREAKQPASKKAEGAISGREIFMREWLPNDPRSHGGDGLGPVYNDSSCVACHNQGGAGGGGSASKNVNIVSAAFNVPIQQMVRPRPGLAESLVRIDSWDSINPPLAANRSPKRICKNAERLLVEEITNLHPGFRTANSVVIHHFGNNEQYENWKSNLLASDEAIFQQGLVSGGFEAPAVMLRDVEEGRAAFARAKEAAAGEEAAAFHPTDLQRGRNRLQRVKSRVPPVVFSSARQHGNFALSQSQRNATALFGAGLIDAVPDKVLEEAAKKKYKDYPEVSGRVARLPDGKIGRFGWKAQKASLRDFTVTACAVELGLHVPEHPQSGDPNKPEYKPVGYDLTRRECDALVEYIRDLPAPAMRKAAHPLEKKFLDEGRTLMAKVGCTTCHTEKLGDAQGIYSDLLVHDMGGELGDTGSYGVFLPDSPGGDDGSPVPPITELTKPLQQEQVTLLNLAFSRREKRLHRRDPPGMANARASGACGTRLPTSTTAGRTRSNKPSPCTAAKAPNPHFNSSLWNPRTNRKWCSSSNPSPPPPTRLRNGDGSGQSQRTFKARLLCRSRVSFFLECER